MSEIQDRSAEIERGLKLLGMLIGAGYERIEPAVLQPASVYLDQSGEDIRGRLYLTSDMAGQDFCLRPEYTIPVFQIYLSSPRAGGRASYSYLGPVFRYRQEGSGEFIQAGLESFGRSDREAADAEILALALEAAESAAGMALNARIGDVGLFTRLIDALALPDAFKRRLRRGHAQGLELDAMLAPPNGKGASEHDGVLAALANSDRTEARALVEDLLSIAGIASVGGRTAAEIAERFLEQASARSGAGVGPEQRGVLRRFFEIAGDPDASSTALRTLASEAGLELGEALDEFDARLNFIAARGVDLARVSFSTKFDRRLDYYTGFVFEAGRPNQPDAPLVGGGRYDRLSRALGSSADIPAVGAAIWCERLFGDTNSSPETAAP